MFELTKEDEIKMAQVRSVVIDHEGVKPEFPCVPNFRRNDSLLRDSDYIVDISVDFDIRPHQKDELLSELSRVLSAPGSNISGTIHLSGKSSDILKLRELLCQK